MPIDTERSRIEMNFAAMRARPEEQEPRLVGRSVLFRLERIPTQEDASHAWAVLGPDARAPVSLPIVRGVCLDCGSAERGEPRAVRIRDVEVAPSVANEWLRDLRTIRIPVGDFEEVMGLDGTGYALSLASGYTHADLSWWCEGPDEWRELVDWARRTMQALHTLTFPNEALDEP
jgi:hypothetical protein